MRNVKNPRGSTWLGKFSAACAMIAADGTLGEPELAAGGPDESIAQPEWSPDGILHFVSDRTGWWNLYRLLDGPVLDPLGPMPAEFADPAWVFGRSSYGFLADGALAATGRYHGRDRLFHVRPDELVGEVVTPVDRRAQRSENAEKIGPQGEFG